MYIYCVSATLCNQNTNNVVIIGNLELNGNSINTTRVTRKLMVTQLIQLELHAG